MSNLLLTPDYLSIDYETYKKRIITILRKTTEFKDFDFEGSNLSVLIELLGYQNELITYYLNKIALEVYDDSAQLYENVWRIASLKGYKARGYISAKTNITVSIPQIVPRINQKNFDFGEIIYIPYGTKFTATIPDITDNKQHINLDFISCTPLMLTVPTYTAEDDINLQFTFNVPVIQGDSVVLTYTGNDIVDNKIYLPFYQFNHDIFDNQEHSTMSLSVNGEYWTRLPNFYSGMSNLNDNTINDDNKKVFSLSYNKYQQYVIEFSKFKEIPSDLDDIEITIIKCNGAQGNIGKNLITKVEANKIINMNKQIYIKNEYIAVTNNEAATGGQNPQEITDLVDGGRGNISSQERCVTSNDYITYLKSRQDILAANAFGEKDISKLGNTKEYNKVHISIVPAQYNAQTVIGTYENWETDIKKGYIFKPKAYYSGFVEDLKRFLEPRKIITTYEQFEIPDIVYFAFHIGLKVNKFYNFVDVSNVFMDKLEYYFAAKNRNFADTISFMDMHNWLLDTNNVTQTKTWDLIKGIENIVFRQIWINSKDIPVWKRNFYSLPIEGGKYIDNEGIERYVSKGYNIQIPTESLIYPPNDELDYPQYTKKDFMYPVDNKLKVIQLGPNQFPILATEFCGINQEN